jgi:hypothetical protein
LTAPSSAGRPLPAGAPADERRRRRRSGKASVAMIERRIDPGESQASRDGGVQDALPK